MENKGRRILSVIISIVIIAVYAFLRFQRFQAKQERQKAQQEQVKNSQVVQQALQDNQNKLNEAAAKIKQAADSVKDKKSTTESEELKNAEMNKAIEGGYSIVKKDGKFYLVKDNNFSKAVELTGVTEALVIPTTAAEENLKYNVLVVKKDGEYRVVDETGKEVLVLTGETITEGTTFVLKGDTLYIK
mgnify:CR=1 FL=1